MGERPRAIGGDADVNEARLFHAGKCRIRNVGLFPGSECPHHGAESADHFGVARKNDARIGAPVGIGAVAEEGRKKQRKAFLGPDVET